VRGGGKGRERCTEHDNTFSRRLVNTTRSEREAANKGRPRRLALYTLHPTPKDLHPTTYTLHPKTYTLHPEPYAQSPTPYTLYPTP